MNLKILKVNIFNLFRKEYLYIYWIPRIIVSLIFIKFYQNIHISNEQWHPQSIFTVPDENVYLNTNLFNPLFSISIKILHFIDKYYLIRIFLGELISSWSCIALYENIRKIVFINKISLLIMAVHPMLSDLWHEILY